MNALRQIPLHVLLLAGLAASASSQETSPKPAAPKAPSADAAQPAGPVQPYVGVNVLPLTPRFREQDLGTELPEGVGIVVGFVDPKGPAASVIQEKDVLTRLDDQVLVNPEQFRTLVRNRKPGQSVKLVRVRGAEVETVEVALASRPASAPLAASPRPALAQDPSVPGGVRITINGQEIDPSQMIGGGTVTFGTPGALGGQVVIVGPGAGNLPPEIRQQLEAMRQRGLPVPQLDLEPASPSQGSAAPSRRTTTFSRSFSLGTGSGVAVSSSSSYTDEQGTVQVRKDGDKRFATVKDAGGETLFDGEITTPDQLKSVPEPARERIKLADGLVGALPGKPAPVAAPEAAPSGETKSGKAPAPRPRKPIDPREGA